ncbi:hypothetical protein M3Y95_01016600 [Aphelenchoides besseyi]|nr:hypothetical protein M3Y95_01016600 [Aphelenchoides besseyi]
MDELKGVLIRACRPVDRYSLTELWNRLRPALQQNPGITTDQQITYQRPTAEDPMIIDLTESVSPTPIGKQALTVLVDAKEAKVQDPVITKNAERVLLIETANTDTHFGQENSLVPIEDETEDWKKEMNWDDIEVAEADVANNNDYACRTSVV